ncbi:MAG: hypothetical protein ACYSUB_01955 [Planctomycetota bacterium]|jgi:hypothetical protein
MAKDETQFQEKQRVWWLDKCFWQVRRVVVVKYCYSGDIRWAIRCANGIEVITSDMNLFTSKKDAYESGIEQLDEKKRALLTSLSDIAEYRQNLIDRGKGEDLSITF